MTVRTLKAAATAAIFAFCVTELARASEGNEMAPVADALTPVKTMRLGSLAGYYLAARHAGFSKDLSAAAGYYASALARDPDNTELLDRSVLMNVAAGDIEKAARLAERLLELEPNDQVALLATIAVALRGQEVDSALESISTLEDTGGQLQLLMGGLMRAWTMAMDGRAARAVNLLDDLEGPSWFDAFTNLHAGLVADHAGLNQIAEERLSRAMERDPGAIRVVDAYARALARSGKTDRAIAVLDRFDESIGGGDSSYTESVRQEIASGEVNPQITDPRAGVAEALYGIGSAMGREGSDTFAASLLQLSLFLAPGAYYPSMGLGQVLEAMRQHEAAIEVYRAIPGSPHERRAARVQEALNLNILERHDEAIAVLANLVEENPDDIATAIALGNVYRSRERFAQAEAVYSDVIERMGAVPDAYWTLYYYRGISRERESKWSGAEADFRQALELQPEQPLVLNYLGYSLIDRGENLDEALDMVRQAVEQRPQDGYIVDSLGWAYYRLGRYEDAVRELERAVRLRPNDPVINDHLGDAYWQVGRKLEAMFQWSHARDMEPEPKDLEKILVKLEKGLVEPVVPVVSQDDSEPAGDADEVKAQ